MRKEINSCMGTGSTKSIPIHSLLGLKWLGLKGGRVPPPPSPKGCLGEGDPPPCSLIGGLFIFCLLFLFLLELTLKLLGRRPQLKEFGVTPRHKEFGMNILIEELF